MQRRTFTFLIFLISESSSDGAAAGLAWIFSVSLSSPAICQRSSQKTVWSHLLRFFSLTFLECKQSDWVNGAGPGTTVSWHFSLELCSLHCWHYVTISSVFHFGHLIASVQSLNVPVRSKLETNLKTFLREATVLTSVPKTFFLYHVNFTLTQFSLFLQVTAWYDTFLSTQKTANSEKMDLHLKPLRKWRGIEY